jgi:hypothetical protein
VRLVAAGSRISLAPACVANFAMPGVVYDRVRSRHWTSIDIGLKPNLDNPAGEALLRPCAGNFRRRGLAVRPAGPGSKRLTRLIAATSPQNQHP